MSNVNNHQSRSRPALLILLLLSAVGLQFILHFVIPNAVTLLLSIRSPVFEELLREAVAFPFKMTCVVWLTARRGRTVWSTWTVPLMLFILLSWLQVCVHFIAASFPSVANLRIDKMFFLGIRILRSDLYSGILLAFLFRATTLHLRPVEIASLPCRLTVLSILLLTTAVAIELATDAPTYQNVWTQVINRPQNLFYILFAFLDHAMTALVWFSTAWLFVARNPMRWIGIVGLVVYLIFSGHYCFIIEPLDIPAIGPLYYGGLFAVIIFHLSVSFLSLGMMHLAGYRWDILANSAWSRRSVSR